MSEKRYTFDTLPTDVSSMKALKGYDITDPYCVAALAVAAFCRYADDKAAAIDMINELKGPEKLSEFAKQFINDRFMDGKGYVPMSYFDGATSDNNYTPTKPYTITVSDNPYSDDQAGYKKLFLKSGGADSVRPIVLRQKASTGEYFLWEYEGVLAGIRVPKSEDSWA